MYIDIVPNRKSPPAVLLREGFRQDGKVVKRTLANLSSLPPHAIEVLRRSLKGETFCQASLPDAFSIVRSRSHGAVAAVLGAARQCGLAKLIAPAPSPVRNLVMAMVVARILNPRSKLATARGLVPQRASDTLAEELGLSATVDEQDLYGALDWLVEQQPKIEKRLAKKHLKEDSLVLYDLTSVWMEGRHCPLAKFGHSRDGKRGKRQFEFGLMCDAEGRPVAVEVFEGNRADPSTVAHQVGTLRKRFGLNKVVLVADRGMLTQKRIDEDLKPNDLDWVTALRAPQILKLVEKTGFQLDLLDERNLAEITNVESYPGERFMVCRNPVLGAERARKREALLQATERRLEEIVAATQRQKRRLKGAVQIQKRVGKHLNARKVGKHFQIAITEDSFCWSRNAQSIDQEAALDGFYVIRTSLPEDRMDSKQVVGNYKRLSAVERAFRSFKTVDLKVRPVHHRLDKRVRAHVLCCMLAWYVEFHLRRQLAPLLYDDEETPQRPDPVAPAVVSASAKNKAASGINSQGFPVQSFRDLLQHLSCLNRNRIRPKITGQHEFDMLTQPTPVQQEAFRLLKVKP